MTFNNVKSYTINYVNSVLALTKTQSTYQQNVDRMYYREQGAQVRSRVEQMEKGEKSNRFVFDKQKASYDCRKIFEIKG